MKRKLFLLLALMLGFVTSMTAQRDVTSTYITNAKLTESFNVGWTTANFNGDHTQGHNTEGYAVESYAGWGSVERPTYSMKQNITLPAGNYRLVNYSFYRYGNTYDTDASKSEAYLVAGENKTLIKTLGSIAGQGAYANSMAEAANRFETKMYRNVIEFTIDADNTTISVGVEGTHSEAKSWFICGMFELFDLDDVASVSSPTDMTYAITNPGFEYLNLTGWTSEGFNYVDDNDNIGGKSGAAYVEYYKWGGLENNKYISQTLTGLENGLYEVTVYGHQQQGTPNDGVKLYANSDYTYIGSTTKDYSVRTTVNDGNLTIKIQTEGSTANWTAFDKFRLKFYGDPLEAYRALLQAAVDGAQALIDGAAGSAISTTAKAAWQAVVDANDDSEHAFTEESQFNTAIANIEAANTNYQAMAAPYAKFNALKTAANAIADVDYTETVSGSYATFTTAISTQTTAVEAATTPATINDAISAMPAAIKTYIAGAEPENDGEYFDITCLMTNPDFATGDATGWTYLDAPGVNWSNCEYYQKEFDINQTVTGLPTGSYSLSVQAFQRPGWAAAVYDDYIAGTDNATSVLYINSVTSKVKNIAADAQDTYKLGDGSNFDWPNDSRVGTDPNYKYLPNSQEGAKLYFDADLYDATCAAVVTEGDGGSLTLGFKSTADHVEGDWTIFDNFRLYYYGSSLLIYYKQYLPQLKTEANADLSNAAYANVLGGSEDAALQAAIDEDPAEETEDAYKAVIDGILAAQTTFCAAKTSYDNIVAARGEAKLDEIADNIGTGVFQHPSNTASLWDAYDEAKTAVDDQINTSSTTASYVQGLVDTYNTAKTNYQPCFILNAPSSSTRYNVILRYDGYQYDGKAITYIANDRSDMGLYNIKYQAAPDANFAQALLFTQVSGNTYKMSQVDADGNERYMCTGARYDGGNTSQIRTTTTADDALIVEIRATNTDGVFNIYNTEANNFIGSQDAGVFTVNSHINFTIQEASQAEPNLTVVAGVNWATFMSPFAVDLNDLDDVEAYTVSGVDEGVTVMTAVSEDIIPANTPVLLYRATSGPDNYVPSSLSGWGTAASDTYENGLLTGSYEIADIPVNSYALQKKDSKVGFYKVTSSGIKVGVNRAYLTLPAETPAREAFFFEDDETGINTIGEKAASTLQDLLNGADVYDLSGRKVTGALEKNKVYIVNGNKIYVK